MDAGREMDALVAEKVMGWVGPVLWVEDEHGRDPYLFAPDAKPEHIATLDRDWDCIVPYSTDMDAALDLVSALAARGIRITASSQQRIASGDSPTLAICRAALAAVGEYV